MRKFTVQSKKGETIIYELDVEIVTALQDPSIMWLPFGEYKASIVKPESLYMKREKIVDGKKEIYMEPDVWHSHALYDEYRKALDLAVKTIEHDFEFKLCKHNEVYTDVDVAAAMLSIKLVKLPNSTFLTDVEKLKLEVPKAFSTNVPDLT